MTTDLTMGFNDLAQLPKNFVREDYVPQENKLENSTGFIGQGSMATTMDEATLEKLDEPITNSNKEKLEKENESAFNYGMREEGAENAGLMDRNSKTSNADKKKKTQKQREAFFRMRMLNDAMQDLQNALNEIAEARAATGTAQDLYKKGKLDYKNPEHIALLLTAGITREDIESKGDQAFENRKDKLWQEEKDIKDLQKTGKKLQNEGASEKEIQDFKRETKAALNNNKLLAEGNIAEQKEAIENIGTTENEKEELLKEASEGVSFFDDIETPPSISVASELDGQAIQAKNISEEFAKAASPDRDEANADIKPDVGVPNIVPTMGNII